MGNGSRVRREGEKEGTGGWRVRVAGGGLAGDKGVK